METAYLAGGCFWCVEAIFQRVNGVIELKVGTVMARHKTPLMNPFARAKLGTLKSLKLILMRV